MGQIVKKDRRIADGRQGSDLFVQKLSRNKSSLGIFGIKKAGDVMVKIGNRDGLVPSANVSLQMINVVGDVGAANYY